MPQTQPLAGGTERGLGGFRENAVGFSSTYCLFPESQCHTDARQLIQPQDTMLSPLLSPTCCHHFLVLMLLGGFNTNIQSS